MALFTAPDGVRLHYQIEGAGRRWYFISGGGADSDLWRAAGYVAPLAQSNGQRAH